MFKKCVLCSFASSFTPSLSFLASFAVLAIISFHRPKKLFSTDLSPLVLLFLTHLISPHLINQRSFWALATDTLPPQDAIALSEDLGIETDTAEHALLEKSALCVPATQGSKGGVLGKRRR